MRHVTSLILGISAGIAGYAGMTHLLIGAARRPRDRTHLIFGLLSSAIAVHTLMVLALHTAASTAAYVVILKYGFGSTSFASILSLMWFVAHYTGVRPRRFLLAMSLWLGLVFALHLSLPFGILYAEVGGLRRISLPWGESIVIAGGAPHPLRLLFDLFYLTLFVFCFTALKRQYRDRSRDALVLGLAIALFLVARVVDTLLVLGAINTIYTTQFAFLGIVIAMSLVLSHGITQTEIELHSYQQHLQDMVTARTTELTRANDQLVQEIHTRAQLDAALERRVEQLTALKRVAEIGIRTNDLTAALQDMSEIATTLFAARLTLILLPAGSATDLRVLVSYERSVGPVDPLPLNAALSSLPLMDQPLDGGQALVIADLQASSLPPALQVLVTMYQLHSVMHIPLTIRGALVGVMAVAIDQAGRTFTDDEVSLAETIAGDMSAAIANTRLYQRVIAARERLTLLYQAGQTLSQASLDPEQIYAALHTAAARLMSTEAFVIALFDTARQGVDYVYLADKDGRRPGGRYPLAQTFAASMLGRDALVQSNDVSAFRQSEFVFELFGDLPGTQSGMAVLLRGSERILGLVFVRSYAKGTYSDEDQEALELLAAHAAIALENAWRYRQARELATSEERTRLARELHDAVTQTLYSASLLAEVLPIVWQRNAAEGERNLALLRQLVRGALAEMRTLLFELRPAALIAADLGPLLRQLGEVLTSHTRIPVELTIDGTTQLPADVHIAVYRIAQEAFNNIVKHAGATQVCVTFRAAPDALFLAVRDDGRGFDPTTIPDHHMGVRIMAERAAGIGARLQIDSAPWRGTEVSVSWSDPSGTR